MDKKMSDSTSTVSEGPGEGLQVTVESEAQQLECERSSSPCSDPAAPPRESSSVLITPDPSEKGPTSHPNGHIYSYGTQPVCSPPAMSILQQNPRISSTSSVCTRISRASQSSHKSSASQIQDSAGDDCCVHSVLDCLFCEFCSLCAQLVDRLTCGGSCGEQCCCSCCGPQGPLGDESTSPCDLECGVLQDCCGSSDCLEICLECCSICFPT